MQKETLKYRNQLRHLEPISSATRGRCEARDLRSEWHNRSATLRLAAVIRPAGLLAVVIGLIANAAAGVVAERVRAASGFIIPALTESVILGLPSPSPALKVSGNCISSDVTFAEPADAQRAGWTLRGYTAQLQLWGVYHYGARASTSRGNPCSDGRFIVRAWQAALGEPETGTLTVSQGARLVEVVDRLDFRFADAKSRASGTRPPVSARSSDPVDPVVPKGSARLTQVDIRSLPAEMSPEFRNPANYTAKVDKNGPGWFSRNNCAAFALNQWGIFDLAGRGRDQQPVASCDDLISQVQSNRRITVQRAGSGDTCPANSWLVLFARSTLGGFHVVRRMQWDDGPRFAQVEGFGHSHVPLIGDVMNYLDPTAAISFLVVGGRYVRTVPEMAQALASVGYSACPALCISSDQVRTLESRGYWTAVSSPSEINPRGIGIQCGPYTQYLDLAIGMPNPGISALIPGASEGRDGILLEAQSNYTGKGEFFPYSGTNLRLAGRMPLPNATTLHFDRFHDSLFRRDGAGELSPTTGQMIPLMIDPRPGVTLEILGVEANTLRARATWHSPCATDILFKRTSVLRGQPLP